MPNLVSSRRRRSRDEAEETDSLSVASRTSKRARNNGNENSSSDDGSPPGSGAESSSDTMEDANPPLPTSFRADGVAKDPSSLKHPPGAIVRVKLGNFMTYKAVELFPGPSLNMVIGPNGTGKSTLVSAICIGLGWDPKYLGRQKEVSEFIKHGESEGFIEIELKHGPRQNRNPVVRCQVKRDANKTIYTLNGRTSNKKQIQELARSFSIQIDNLCQFLPQDKVVEFAGMSPIELLQSTQQAVASKQMIRWHQQLSEWRQDQRKVEAEESSGQETLKNLEARQKAQEADVARVREREQVQRSIAMWQKLKPLIRYQALVNQRVEQKRQKEEAERDLVRLQESLEPALRSVNSKAEYRDAVTAAKKGRAKDLEVADRGCSEQEAAVEKVQQELADASASIERERKAIKDDRVELTRLQDGLKTIESQMRSEPPQVDLMSINEQIRGKERRQIEIREEAAPALRTELDRMKEEAGAINRKIASRRDNIEGLDSRAGKQENKLQKMNGHTYRAWKYVQEHQDLFEKPIYGPPMVECSVKDQRYVPLIEALFQRNDFMYLVAQTRGDFLKLHALVKEQLRLAEVNIRTSSNGIERFPRPPVPASEMEQWGLEGWALDFVEGPEPVLAALCETINLHRTAVSLQDTSQAQFDTILARSAIQSWVTSKSYYRVTRRREYGPEAMSTTVRDVRPPQVWTDQPVDPEAKREMEREVAELQEELEALKANARELQMQLKALGAESDTLRKEIDELKSEKDEQQKIQSMFKALPTRHANQTSKVQDRQRRMDEKRANAKEYLRKRDQLLLARAEAVVAFAESTAALQKAHEQLYDTEVILIEAISDHETLIERNQTVAAALAERQAEVQRIKEAYRQVSAELQTAKNEAMKLSAALDDEERAFVQERSHLALMDVDAEIAAEEARLELMAGGGGRVLAEYEERGRRIAQLQRRQSELAAALADLAQNVQQVRANWEPQLDRLVKRISDAFAFNMQQIHCAGEVSVHKDADFAQWSILIQVKFREHEPLTPLDAHRQSGGERAVATVFYLMSLQALTRSPFRVVDEINQGMDPRNERLVHSRMVAIATGNDEWERHYREQLGGGGDDGEADDGDRPEGPDAGRHSAGRASGNSQYFLITPKLLHNLRYDEGMTVLCITSGEHLQSANGVDFGKALAVLRQRAPPERPAAAT